MVERMATLLTEIVTDVHHWNSTLFSFKTTRDRSFRFRNGHFTMIGLPSEKKPLLRAYSFASANHVIKFYKDNYYKATGNVILINLETKDVLNTEELLWYPEKEKFVTDKFLTIKTDDELHKGEGMESNQDFSSYRIIKPMGSIQFEE